MITTTLFLTCLVLCFTIYAYFEFPADWYWGDPTTDYEGNVCESIANCFLSSIYYVFLFNNYYLHIYKGIRLDEGTGEYAEDRPFSTNRTSD